MKKLPPVYLAEALVHLRVRSKLTQAEVAARMTTTQTAIAQLESGRQLPSMQTLHSYARANGYCLEIGFVQAQPSSNEIGCIVTIQDWANELEHFKSR